MSKRIKKLKTDIQLESEGNIKALKNVLVDTEAVQIILNYSFVSDLSIKV